MFYFRLLDVWKSPVAAGEIRMKIVFEYVDQDLARYLENCPPPGLDAEKIKVLLDLTLTHINKSRYQVLKQVQSAN